MFAPSAVITARRTSGIVVTPDELRALRDSSNRKVSMYHGDITWCAKSPCTSTSPTGQGAPATLPTCSIPPPSAAVNFSQASHPATINAAPASSQIIRVPGSATGWFARVSTSVSLPVATSLAKTTMPAGDAA